MRTRSTGEESWVSSSSFSSKPSREAASLSVDRKGTYPFSFPDDPYWKEVPYILTLIPTQTNREGRGSCLLTCSSGTMRAWVDSSPSEGCRRLLVEGCRGAENRGASPGQPAKPLEKLETV